MGIVRDGNCSGWELTGGNCPGWEMSRMGIVRDGNCPGWELSGENCPGWELSGMGIVRWELSGMGTVRDRNCPGWELSTWWELSGMGTVRDGNCPGWELSGNRFGRSSPSSMLQSSRLSQVETLCLLPFSDFTHSTKLKFKHSRQLQRYSSTECQLTGLSNKWEYFKGPSNLCRLTELSTIQPLWLLILIKLPIIGTRCKMLTRKMSQQFTGLICLRFTTIIKNGWP